MREITKSEYLQIVGLMVLAKQHHSFLEDIEKSLAEILKQKYDCGYGHISDDLWQGLSDAKDLLRRMDIKIKN